MRKLRSILCVFTFALFSVPVLATTYYVSPNGNDAYPGISPLVPWKTVAHVNNARLNVGDSVLFLAGATWREALISSATGVTYGSYGTGPRPTISGANIYNSGWTSVRSNVWTVVVGEYEPEQVWFNGVLGQHVGSATAVLAPNQWFFDSTGSLYVYSAGSPNTSASVEAAQRDSAFQIIRGGNITVSGLAFVNPNYTAINIASTVFGTQTFNNVLWRGAQYEGLVATGGSQVVSNSEGIYNQIGISIGGGNGIAVTNSILSGNAESAIEVYGTLGPSTINTSTLTGNATPDPLSPTVQADGTFPLSISNSIYLPNPEYSILSTVSGLTDNGTNLNASPAFKQRGAPLIIVPFVDDYNNLAVAQSVSDLAHQYGCTVSYALNTKLVTAADWKKISLLQQSGTEIVAHTRSHSDLANNNVVTIQYKGAAPTATMSIVNGVSLKTFLNGSSTPDLNVDLSNTYNGMIDVCGVINKNTAYSCVPLTNQSFFTPALLASASNVNIKKAYVAVASSTYLNWEVEGAIADIQSNIAGYTVKSFATPFTSSSPAVETHIQNAGLAANRNGVLTPDNLPNGNWLLSGPFDVYNLAAMFIPSSFDSTKPTSSTAAMVEGMGSVGGVIGIYAHGVDEFSLASWQALFQKLQTYNATCMTMNQAIQYIQRNGFLVPDGTNRNWVSSVPLNPNFANTTASPVQGAHGLQ